MRTSSTANRPTLGAGYGDAALAVAQDGWARSSPQPNTGSRPGGPRSSAAAASRPSSVARSGGIPFISSTVSAAARKGCRERAAAVELATVGIRAPDLVARCRKGDAVAPIAAPVAVARSNWIPTASTLESMAKAPCGNNRFDGRQLPLSRTAGEGAERSEAGEGLRAAGNREK
jgi:hypothetical protein